MVNVLKVLIVRLGWDEASVYHPFSSQCMWMIWSKILNLKESGIGIPVGDMKISMLFYADDLVIFSDSRNGLQNGITALHGYYTKRKLKRNGNWIRNNPKSWCSKKVDPMSVQSGILGPTSYQLPSKLPISVLFLCVMVQQIGHRQLLLNKPVSQCFHCIRRCPFSSESLNKALNE